MRRLFGIATAVAFVSGVAAPVSAAVLPFTATLEVEVGTLPAVVVNGAGTGTSDGPGAAATIPAGVFSLAFTTPIVPPLLGAIFGLGIGAPGQNGATAPFAPGSNEMLNYGGGATGTMGLNAAAYLLNAKNKAVAAIPLNIIGVGGTTTFTALGLISGTISANPYQLGAVMVTGTLGTDPPTVLTATGVDERTAGGGGTLRLVSPTFISLGFAGSLPSIATLTITYVPEPGTLLLLGAGLAGLGAVGRKRLG